MVEQEPTPGRRFGSKGIAMGNAVPPSPAAPVGSPPQRPRPDAGMFLTLVNGVLAGVASVYVGTRSVLITVTAGAIAIVLAAMVRFSH